MKVETGTDVARLHTYMVSDLKSLVDGAYEIVALYKPESEAQRVWQREWLETAKLYGAGFEI